MEGGREGSASRSGMCLLTCSVHVHVSRQVDHHIVQHTMSEERKKIAIATYESFKGLGIYTDIVYTSQPRKIYTHTCTCTCTCTCTSCTSCTLSA